MIAAFSFAVIVSPFSLISVLQDTTPLPRLRPCRGNPQLPGVDQNAAAGRLRCVNRLLRPTPTSHEAFGACPPPHVCRTLSAQGCGAARVAGAFDRLLRDPCRGGSACCGADEAGPGSGRA